MTEQTMRAPRAKRVGPPEIEPVNVGDLRIEAIHWGRDRGLGQNGGYVAAFDAKSGVELWTLKVYDVQYDPQMEADVQDIFIRSMKKTLFGRKLKITDERRRNYVVDVDKRAVVPQ